MAQSVVGDSDQIILAAYFQADVWFPLGSWNDQPGKRLIALLSEGQAVAALGFALTMLLPLLLFALALWRHWVWLMWIGLIGYGAWAVLQIQSLVDPVDLRRRSARSEQSEVSPKNVQNLSVFG